MTGGAASRGDAASRAGARRPGGGAPAGRKPAWLRVKAPVAGAFRATGALLDDLRLHTVCDEARCPNKGECFSAGTATFLILGDVCTRGCRFCAVTSAAAHKSHAPGAGSAPGAGAHEDGPPGLRAVDADEPARVAAAASRLGLRHVVVTSVTRDDLGDGGAGQFAATIRAVRAALPAATVEVLVPDFAGAPAPLASVLAARPDVLNHNLETVPRLYPEARPQAAYERSLEVLRRATAATPRPLVKTGLMVGLGESFIEVRATLGDAAAAGADIVTVGQYLQPDNGCLPVARYVEPGEFVALETEGARLGLRVVAGPFVRSSYHAAEILASSGAQT